MQPGCEPDTLTLYKIHYLYTMMKACGKYLTLFLSVLVLLTTTLQFHHHDCHGSIFFPLSFEKDIVIDADDGIVALDDCPHHYKEGASHAPDCKGHKKCSMHIDQSDISRQYLPFLFFPVISNLYKLELKLYPGTIISGYMNDSGYFLRHLSLIIRASSIFRAPPFMNL